MLDEIQAVNFISKEPETVFFEQVARKIRVDQNRRDFGMQLSAFWTGARADC